MQGLTIRSSRARFAVSDQPSRIARAGLTQALEGSEVSSSPQAKLLSDLLLERSAHSSPVSGLAAWEAFKAFGREAFELPGVGLLFQTGTFDFTGSELFYFDPVCQFEILDHDGEHDHFEQLHCELTCEPRPELQTASAELWSFDFPTADAFFSAVESLPAFQIAARQSDYTVSVTHEDV